MRKGIQNDHWDREKGGEAQVFHAEFGPFQHVSGQAVPKGGDDSRHHKDGAGVKGGLHPSLEEPDDGLASKLGRGEMRSEFME